MSQQQQVMLRGEHRGRRILLWILALLLCTVILDTLNPGMLRQGISVTLNAANHLWDYLGDVLSSLQQMMASLANWFH